MTRISTPNVGIRIQISVMIPSAKKPGKGIVISRAEESVVLVDPTDVDTMIAVLRGSLVNANITMPMDLMCAEDNEIFEVDLECPECRKAKKSGKGKRS